MNFRFASQNKRISRVLGLSSSNSATEVISWFQFNGASVDNHNGPKTTAEVRTTTPREDGPFTSILTHHLD